MQLIEAALAFAITMLALSLVVSSFVEIIHRIFSMREGSRKNFCASRVPLVANSSALVSVTVRSTASIASSTHWPW